MGSISTPSGRSEGELTIAPIISGVGLRNFMPSQPAYRTLRQVQRRVTIFWIHQDVICFQLSVAAVVLNNMRYKESLRLVNVARQMAPLSSKNRFFCNFERHCTKSGGQRVPNTHTQKLTFMDPNARNKNISRGVDHFRVYRRAPGVKIFQVRTYGKIRVFANFEVTFLELRRRPVSGNYKVL